MAPAPEAPYRSVYSSFVRVMRLALPLGVLCLGGALIFWQDLVGGDGSMIVPEVGEITLNDDGRVQLASPRYVGQDGDGGGYEITATNAWVDPRQPNLIELDAMVADFPDEDGRAVKLEATKAHYNRTASNMLLENGVVLVTSDGYRLQTQRAWVKLEDGEVDTETPVDGDGPDGTIRATRMEVRDNGDVIRFVGDVHALFR